MNQPAVRPTLAAVGLFLAVSFLMHWGWETAHGVAYVETALPLATRVWHCLPMAGIDALWSAGIVMSALALAGRAGSIRVVVLAATALGAATAILIEWYAVRHGRWTYNELMPLVPLVRVGWWPVLQMAILPPIAMTLTRRFSRRASSS
jgi:hypothetical protein